jgi:hypothetical protein
MNHYDFPQQFHALYELAVTLHAGGKRGPAGYFSPNEQSFLAANGLSGQNLYDYAEDHNGYAGEPGPDHALAIELVRRDYFLNAQRGGASTTTLDETRLPAKTDTVRGIAWLPRLIPKAHAKLRGELPPTLMFCCGGDRRFFKEHNILPAEFLSLVWRHENQPDRIVDWVVQRGKK